MKSGAARTAWGAAGRTLARGAWIEIKFWENIYGGGNGRTLARGAWIEILSLLFPAMVGGVAPSQGGVD